MPNQPLQPIDGEPPKPATPTPKPVTPTPAPKPAPIPPAPNFKTHEKANTMYSDVLANPNYTRHTVNPRDYQRSYWEEPYNVAKYYNLIRTAPKGWQPPPWLDTNAVTQAYDYMRLKNNFKPVTEWMTLPKEDPATEFLKGMGAPPEIALMPNESKWKPNPKPMPEQPASEIPNYGNYEDLYGWQKAGLILIGNQGTLAGRPEMNKLGSQLFKSGVQALGGMGIGSAIGAIIGGTIGGLTTGGLGILPGAALGGKIGGWIGGGVTFGASWIQMSEPEQEFKAINDILEFSDFLAIGTERLIGFGAMANQQGLDKVMEDPEAAWRAGSVNYEVAKQQFWNAFASVFGGEPAKEGETWRFSEGFKDPVPVEGSKARGTDALIEATARYQELVATGMTERDATNQLIAEYTDKFGDTAVANDFVYQSVLDPANIAPWMIGKTGASVAKAAGQPRLAEAFKVNTGSPIIDALPFPLQPLVSQVTRVRGSGGLFDALDTYRDWVRAGTYPASMFNLPKDTRNKYLELVKAGVRIEDIAIDGDTLKWNDKTGKPQTFKGSANVMTQIPDIKNLSKFDKYIGGINETYGLNELAPTTGKKDNFISRLWKLTPEAQAHIILNLYHQLMATLMNRANGDPIQMAKFYQQAAGRMDIKPGDPGEAILKSPAMIAIRQGIQQATTEGSIENMVGTWISVAGHTDTRTGKHIPGKRDSLISIATALSEKPANIVEQFQQNPEALKLRIQETAPELMQSADDLTVFTGDNPLPWNENQFQAMLVNTVADKMDGFLKNTYGLTKDSTLIRASQILKSIQSLVLLNMNPAYFLNNAINNLVTRAAQGVGGFMTPRQISKFYERFGITPPRLKVGVGANDEGATYSTTDIISSLKDGKDALSKINRIVRKTTNKLGLFSRLSSAVERAESAQATTIGMQTFFGRMWKVDKGIRRMHPTLEAMLDRDAPGVKQAIYAAAESGMNITEITDAIYGGYIKPQIRATIDEVSAKMFPNLPDAGSELLGKLGIIDQLTEQLANATTPEDIDAAFAGIEENLNAAIDNHWSNSMISEAENVRNATETERIPYILTTHAQMERRIAEQWIGMRREWDELYASRGEYVERSAWGAAVRKMFDRQEKEWDRIYKMQTETYAGMIDRLGIDSPEAREYVLTLGESQQNWKDFHAKAKEKRNAFFDGANRKAGEEYEAYRIRRDRDYNTMLEELDALYVEHAGIEAQLQARLNGQFATGYQAFTQWNPVRAQAWRQYLLSLREEMVMAQRAMRDRIKGMDTDARDTAYNEWNPTYNRMIAEMKHVEVLGAEWLKQPPQDGETIEMAIADLKRYIAESDQTPVEVGEPTVRPDTPVPPVPPEEQGTPEDWVNADAIMQKAKDAGIVDKEGRPIANYAINIINEYLRHVTPNGEMIIQYKREDLPNIPMEQVDSAIEYWKTKHVDDQIVKSVKAKLTYEQILAEADRNKRQAAIKQAGYLSRMEVRQQMQDAFEATDTEIDAVMMLIDMHAEKMALDRGYGEPSAARDAWYATRIAQIVKGAAGKTKLELDSKLSQLYQDDTTNWYYHQAERIIEAQMPDVIAPLPAREVPGTTVAERELPGQDPASVGKKPGDKRFVRDGKVYLPGKTTEARIMPAASVKEQILNLLSGTVRETELRWLDIDGFMEMNWLFGGTNEFGDNGFQFSKDDAPVKKERLLGWIRQHQTTLNETVLGGKDVPTPSVIPEYQEAKEYLDSLEIKPIQHDDDEVRNDGVVPVTMFQYGADGDFSDIEEILRYAKEDGIEGATQGYKLQNALQTVEEWETFYQMTRVTGSRQLMSTKWWNDVATLRDEYGIRTVGKWTDWNGYDAQEIYFQLGKGGDSLSANEMEDVFTEMLDEGTIKQHEYNNTLEAINNVMNGIDDDFEMATEYTRYHNYTTRGGSNYREFVVSQEADTGFDDAHFPNVDKYLFHFRTKDEHMNGRKYLRIEEIQSDLSKAMREQGVKGEESEFSNGYEIPLNPIMEHWEEIALKRIMRLAADEGYDAIAIKPGVAHYDLYGSELVAWTKREDGTIVVNAAQQYKGAHEGVPDVGALLTQHNWNSEIKDAEIFEDEDLAAVFRKIMPWQAPMRRDKHREKIAKNVAKVRKMMEQNDEGVYLPRKEGLEGFYDTKIKNLASDVAKRFDATTGEVEIAGYMWNTIELSDASRSQALEPMSLYQDEVDNPEFMRWFRKSAAVDQDGDPLQLYHGTKKQFESFSVDRRGTATQAESAEKAFFFTDEPYVAEGYAMWVDGMDDFRGVISQAEIDRQQTGGAIIPVYLSMQNPLKYDFAGQEYREVGFSDLIDKAIANGHDGVIFYNVDDSVMGDQDSTIYGVFKPEQIKSSIGNRGTYDPSDPNILHQGKGKKGSIKFIEDGRAIIRALEAKDLSTMVHEVGHIFRRDLPKSDVELIAKMGGLRDGNEFLALEQRFLKGDPTYAKYLFLQNNEANLTDAQRTELYALENSQIVVDMKKYVAAEEMFARGWERYLAEGDAPTPEARTLFRKFTDWMLKLYDTLKKRNGRVEGFQGTKLDINIHRELDATGRNLRDIFDDLLVAQASRPPSFEQRILSRAETLQKQGNNYKVAWNELRERARREEVAGILDGYTSAEEARVDADNLADGQRVNAAGHTTYDTDIYDALTAVEKDPNLAPWNQEKKVRKVQGITAISSAVQDPNKLYDFKYTLIDGKDLNASHKWTGNSVVMNTGYPAEFQPRERQDVGAVEDLNNKARNLNPGAVIGSAGTVDRGSIITLKDGTILSGNGRKLFIEQAKAIAPEKFEEYKTALAAKLPEYGIDPAEMSGMEIPILSMELMNPLSQDELIAFVHDANDRVTRDMNDAEIAAADVRHISDQDVAGLIVGETGTIESALTAAGNKPFVDRFFGKLSDNERARYYKDGTLTQSGINRLINAMFMKVYQGADGDALFQEFKLSLDNNVKNIANGVFAALPQTAQAEGLINAGERQADLSLTKDIALVLNRYVTLKNQGKNIAEYIATEPSNMFGTDMTPAQFSLLQFVAFKATAKNIRDLLREYARLVTMEPDVRQAALLPMDTTGRKEQLLLSAITNVEPSLEAVVAAPLSAAEQGIDPAVAARQKVAAEARKNFEEGRTIPIETAAQIGMGKPAVLEGEPLTEPVQVDPLAEIPQQGIHIVKLYSFRHGDTEIGAATYYDGRLVAYAPNRAGMFQMFVLNGGEGRLLGIDPQDPKMQVFEYHGDLMKIDPEKPAATTEPSTLFQEGTRVDRTRTAVTAWAKENGTPARKLRQARFILHDGTAINVPGEHGEFASQYYNGNDHWTFDDLENFLSDTGAIRVGVMPMGDNAPYVYMEWQRPPSRAQAEALSDMARAEGIEQLTLAIEDGGEGRFMDRVRLTTDQLELFLKGGYRDREYASTPMLYQDDYDEPHRPTIMAAKARGVTDDIRKAGFIDIDGDLLDLSEGYNQRSQLHGIYSASLMKDYKGSTWDAEQEFMRRTKAVRIADASKNHVALEIHNRLSRAQYEGLESALYKSNGANRTEILASTSRGFAAFTGADPSDAVMQLNAYVSMISRGNQLFDDDTETLAPIFYNKIERVIQQRMPEVVKFIPARTIPATFQPDKLLPGVDPATVGLKPGDKRIVRDGQVWIPGRATEERQAPAQSVREQVLASIAGMVKEDELYWTGLETWLMAQVQVSKQNVLDFLKENVVVPGEQILGEPTTVPDIVAYGAAVEYTEQDTRTMFELENSGLLWIPEFNAPMMFEMIGKFDEVGRRQKFDASGDDPHNLTEEQMDLIDKVSETYYDALERSKIHEYPVRWKRLSLPGSTNYRELLITYPRRALSADANINTHTSPQYERTLRDTFQHSHWGGTDDVILHVRFDERIDQDGKKVLNILEVQSDWHQMGRKYGYKGEQYYQEIQAKIAPLQAKLDALEEPRLPEGIAMDAYIEETIGLEKVNETGWHSYFTPEQLKQHKKNYAAWEIADTQYWEEHAEEIRDLRKQIETLETRRTSRGRMPEVPFADQWEELAMKRAIRYAAEHGYERVTFASGATAAKIEGHPIQTDLDEIRYDPKTHTVEGYKNGMQTVSQQMESDANLKDHIGEDAAKQLLGSSEGVPPAAKQTTEIVEKTRTIDGRKVYQVKRTFEMEGGDEGTTFDITLHLNKKRAETDAKKPFYLATISEDVEQYFPEGMLLSSPSWRVLAKFVRNRIQENTNHVWTNDYETRFIDTIGADGVKVLKTKDITFGGEQMRWFYDDRLINHTNNIIERFGVKVQDGKIETTREEGSYAVISQETGLRLGVFTTPSAANRFSADMYHNQGIQSEIKIVKDEYANTDTVHYFDITPEMRDTALHEGFELFDDDGDSLSFRDLKDVPSPMSSYIGNKRTMLQAGAYDGLVSPALVNKTSRILDAFGGSGLLGNAFQAQMKKPRILNDFDKTVSSFHATVKSQPDAIVAAIKEEWKNLWNLVQQYPDGGEAASDAAATLWKQMEFRIKNTSDPVTRAAILAIRNNGSLSTMGGGQNLISGSAAADGAYRWKVTADSVNNVIEGVKAHSKLLNDGNVEIRNGDARAIATMATGTDLLLLDPPYVERNVGDERVTTYAAGQDLSSLEGGIAFIKTEIQAAVQRGVPLIYTNNAHEGIIDALTDIGMHFRLERVRSGKEWRYEVLAWSPAVKGADAGERALQTEQYLDAVHVEAEEARKKAAEKNAKQHPKQKRPGAPGKAQPQKPNQQYIDIAKALLSDAPLGAIPMPEPTYETFEEISNDTLKPLLRRTRETYKANMTQGLKWSDVQPQQQVEVKKWVNQLKDDLATTKLAAMRYGEQMRDGALLNYTRRFGIDNIANLVYPYQFWYTRTMMNWLKRVIDRPAWFTMYARLMRLQEEQERKGLPSRLAGKVRLMMPWLPEWMGAGLWIDPYSQTFPMAQFLRPLRQLGQDQSQVYRRAESMLREMVDAGRITQTQMEDALSKRSGSVWEQATKQAELELGKDTNPANLASMLMQPALWWTIPMNIASGTPEKISPLPITRTGQAIRTSLKGTAFEGVGNLAGAVLAGGEEAIRKGAGLSQYGEWGEYYIERMLANMVADGYVTPQEGNMAMIQKSGAAYEEAQRRVAEEMMLKTAGSLPIFALKEGANAVQVAAAIIASMFPAGLLPTGELKMRGLAEEYSYAWQRFHAGDEEAINTFFEEHPEYESRLALFAEPEERMRNFLVNEIWNRYFELDKPNRQKAVYALGKEFEETFFNEDKTVVDLTDIKTLATWAQTIGGMIPQTEETRGLPAAIEPDYYEPTEIDAIVAYQKQRDQDFPLWRAWQDQYYRLPVGIQRKNFVKAHPILQEYWDWKEGEIAKNPTIEKYIEDQKQMYAEQDANDMSAALLFQVWSYFATGKPLSAGALQELNMVWNRNGRKGGTLENYLENMVKEVVSQ